MRLLRRSRSERTGLPSLRCRGAIAQGTVWPDRVVVLPPPFDEHLGLKQRVKRFPFQQLVSQLPVEALYVAVLPRRTRLDKQSLHTNSPQPLPDALGRELWAVVAADVVRHTLADEQVAQPLENVLARQPLPLHLGPRKLEAEDARGMRNRLR